MMSLTSKAGMVLLRTFPAARTRNTSVAAVSSSADRHRDRRWWWRESQGGSWTSNSPRRSP